MSVTLISGVPGVGVSAISEAARRHLENGYELVNFGDVMLEEAATRGEATTRDELSALSRRETERLQRRAGEYVEDRGRETEVLLTTHLAVETADGVVPGLPQGVLRDIDPDLFVLVEAAPETVLERRDQSDRSFEDVSVRRIEFLQDLSRAAAFDYALQADAPVELVENEGDVEENAEALLAVLADEE